MWGNKPNSGSGFIGMLPMGIERRLTGYFDDNRILIDPNECDIMQFDDAFEKPKIDDYCIQMYEGNDVKCIVSYVDVDNKTFDAIINGKGEEMLNIPFSKFKKDNHKMFTKAAKPLIKYLCENHHHHVSVIVTPTNAELLEGIISTREIIEYLKD